jgi:IS30 family transposase
MAHHLKVEEREVIAFMSNNSHSPEAIAQVLKRHPSTIRRELARNTKSGWYRATEAQLVAQKRRAAAKRNCHKMQRPEIHDYVCAKVKESWSPEQVAGRLKSDFPTEVQRHISRQTIYRFVQQDKKAWAPYLRGTRPHSRRPLFSGKEKIGDRPEIINRREQAGHWEGDTVLGTRHRRDGAIVTLVDRKTRYTELIKVPDRQSLTVIDAIEKRLKPHPAELRRSCTFDHGSEFCLHKRLTDHLDLAVYFAQPHCPWQRGTNENTNGLLRQFIPKGKSLRDLSPKELARIQDLLNNRPRKCLGYRTPAEVLADSRAIQT